MRSLGYFPIYLNEENKFQGTLWACEKPKVIVNPKVTFRIYICKLFT